MMYTKFKSKTGAIELTMPSDISGSDQDYEPEQSVVRLVEWEVEVVDPTAVQMTVTEDVGAISAGQVVDPPEREQPVVRLVQWDLEVVETLQQQNQPKPQYKHEHEPPMVRLVDWEVEVVDPAAVTPTDARSKATTRVHTCVATSSSARAETCVEETATVVHHRRSQKLEWDDWYFLTVGFDGPESPFSHYCARRTGRWSRAETKFALRLIHDLITGRCWKAWQHGKTIRTIVSNALHTPASRVSVKFNAMLKQQLSVTMNGNFIPWTADLPFRGWETMQNEVLSRSFSQLRLDFLESIRIDVYKELKYKNKIYESDPK